MADTSPEELTFEQSLAELEKIVCDLEDGQTGLEEALARFETGIGLVKRCYQQLSLAEQRILVLTGQDADGKPALKPFDHTATAGAEAVDGKRKRKKTDEPY